MLCAGTALSVASEAAMPALWPRIMRTGSIRIELNAMCEEERHTGTIKFVTSLGEGSSASYGIGNGPGSLCCMSPSLRT